MDNDKAPRSRPTDERECRECVTGVETPATATTSACTAEPTGGQVFWPRWLGVFLGRMVLRVCPQNIPEEPCEGCHLRALCKCAQDNFLEAASIEKKVWAVLVACGLGALLITLLLT